MKKESDGYQRFSAYPDNPFLAMLKESKMNFFKPEMFHPLSRLHGGPYQNMGEYEAIAHLANELLEREGKVVYGDNDTLWGDRKGRVPVPETHKAILINIELIEKCSHPIEKVFMQFTNNNPPTHHKCNCGAIVIPSAYTEIK